MNYEDKTLHCRDCGNEFLFSSGEQEFFASKGYTNEPRRCPSCRSAFRARQVMLATSARSGHERHTTVCAQCGKEAQVPFLPRLDKPVYCSSCFDQVRVAH